MFRSSIGKLGVAALILFACTTVANAAMVSTMRNVNAVSQANGFSIVPVSEMYISGDESRARVYEIIRPNNERITIGRLNTSCTCVQLEAAKSTFERGERALITLRNVRATPPQGQLYSFYVQIVSPVNTTLRQDAFVQSDRFLQPQSPMPVQYTEYPQGRPYYQFR